MKSNIQNYVVFDLETGGLSNEKNGILEIAACAFDNELNDIGEFESGIMHNYDDREINEGALGANGITRDQIKNGIDPKNVADEFFRYLGKLKKGNSKVVLVGQNCDKFDIPFLINFMEYFKKDLTQIVNTDFTIDTMRWAHVKYPESTNYKLGTLCEMNGVELTNAHRAITDTRATKELVKTFIRSLRSEGKGEKEEVKFRATFQF
jgi:DNA polymerase III alpha subunit (gram-positive type)